MKKLGVFDQNWPETTRLLGKKRTFLIQKKVLEREIGQSNARLWGFGIKSKKGGQWDKSVVTTIVRRQQEEEK